MSFKKLPIIQKENQGIGCWNCGFRYAKLPMDYVLEVGFGLCIATCDGVIIYDEKTSEKTYSVQDIENLALKETEKDWRIRLESPFHGETYQRQGLAEWVCVETNDGFA